MERPSRDPGPRPLYQTADYRIDVVTLASEAIPEPMRKKYTLTHKTHGVTAGMTDQFAGAIAAAEQLQEQLDQAIGGKQSAVIL